MKQLKSAKLPIRKQRRPEDEPLNRVNYPAEDEGLTGFIGDWEASDIEERFGRALSKNEIRFSFREHFFGPTRTTPGAVEVDFLVWVGNMIYPLFIDGEYAHKTQEQKTEDRIKDARFDEYGRKYGLHPSQRIAGDLLQTQDDTDQIVKEMF